MLVEDTNRITTCYIDTVRQGIEVCMYMCMYIKIPVVAQPQSSFSVPLQTAGLWCSSLYRYEDMDISFT